MQQNDNNSKWHLLSETCDFYESDAQHLIYFPSCCFIIIYLTLVIAYLIFTLHIIGVLACISYLFSMSFVIYFLSLLLRFLNR